MPKGYTVVSYRDSLIEKRPNNYAPTALEDMINACAKSMARRMPIRTFDDRIMQHTVIVGFDSTGFLRPHSRVMHTKPHSPLLEMLNVA